MKRWACFVLLIGFLTLQVRAIETSRYIARIVEQLRCDLPYEGTFMCSAVNVGRPLYIERHGEAITQIGVRLFAASIRESLDVVVCNSVERLFLELALLPNVQKQKALLKEYRVSLLYNGFMLGTVQFPSLSQAMEVVTDEAAFTLNSEKGKIILRIKTNDDAVVVTLPADRELLFAYDKKEHETLLREELASWKEKYNSTVMIPDVSELQKTDDGCYVLPGTDYMIDSLKNDTYYTLNNNTAHILFDRNFPFKSLQNVFLGHVATEYVNLNVRYRMYDRKEEYCSMPLNLFLGYMQAQGLDFYSAAYPVKNDETQCLLLMHHPLYDYIFKFRK